MTSSPGGATRAVLESKSEEVSAFVQIGGSGGGRFHQEDLPPGRSCCNVFLHPVRIFQCCCQCC